MLSSIIKQVKLQKHWIIVASLLFAVFVSLVSVISFYYYDKIYPGVRIAGISVENKTTSEATKLIKEKTSAPKNIVLKYEDRLFPISLSDIEFSYDYENTIQNAYSLNRPGGKPNIINIADSYFTKANIPLSFNISKALLNKHISIIADEIATQPIYPSLALVGNEVVVTNGQEGVDVDVTALQEILINKLKLSGFSNTEIAIISVNPVLTTEEIETYRQRGEKLVGKEMLLNFEREVFKYNDNDLLKLVGSRNNYSDIEIDKLITNLKSQIERDPTNPVFIYESGIVREFSPAKDGIVINSINLKEQVISTLSAFDVKDSIEIDIPTSRTKPDISTEDVNDLGIKELIGKGTSTFRGSISSRIHNIGVASKKFNGVLVPPGETLSFNGILGDVSELTGYKQAYIIRDGKTVLGDGGGVCQVSTTLFRAALDAGLPIVERRSHSYRVTYYEQGSPPGLDATVYAPTTNLKIQNDTPNHILIQTTYNPIAATLEFEIYGTSDGRVSTISKPIITSQSPPPEDHYQDDPNLPEGVIEQIDWSAWGAKVQFNYEVIRNGEMIQKKTFYSNYRPWQAKFLRGTGPAI